MRKVLQRDCWPQLKRKLPCPLCPSSFNTEHTERLRGLCVEAFLTTEGAETLHTAGKIFAAREEVDCQRYSTPANLLSIVWQRLAEYSFEFRRFPSSEPRGFRPLSEQPTRTA